MIALLSEMVASKLFDEHELRVLEEAICQSIHNGTRSSLVRKAIEKMRAHQKWHRGE